MSKVEVAPDYKNMKLLYLCERCNNVSTLKHPALNGAVLLIVGGPFAFAPAFYALSQMVPTSWGFTLLAGLGAAVIMYLTVLVAGRFIYKYVPLRDGAA